MHSSPLCPCCRWMMQSTGVIFSPILHILRIGVIDWWLLGPYVQSIGSKGGQWVSKGGRVTECSTRILVPFFGDSDTDSPLRDSIQAACRRTAWRTAVAAFVIYYCPMWLPYHTDDDDNGIDSFYFWHQYGENVPIITALLWKSILYQPLHAPVERLFSHGGIVMRPHRARLAD